jgi:hypothetical protein
MEAARTRSRLPVRRQSKPLRVESAIGAPLATFAAQLSFDDDRVTKNGSFCAYGSAVRAHHIFLARNSFLNFLLIGE